MRTTQKVVLACAVAMFALWIVLNFGVFRRTEVGTSHMALGVIFALLILLRPKPNAREGDAAPQPGPVLVAIAAVSGSLASVAGIVFDVGQFEWLGVLLLLFASLRWSLHGRFSRDTVYSLVLLYWVHPIPGPAMSALHRSMQEISVRGAECLLQAFNCHVWADGLILRTAAQAFMVPEACSGMTTVTTVLMCGAGIGILLRFKWFQMAVLLLAGTVQVVLCNILRIALMVVLADPTQPGWAENFLHDSLGVLLMVSVVLIQLEAAWWRSRSSGTAVREGEVREGLRTDESLRRFPLFWQPLFRWPGIILLSILAAGVGTFFFLRCRPHHRAEMIWRVASDLMHRDIEQAERACKSALTIDPGNEELRKELVRIFLLRGRHGDALKELDSIPAAVRRADHDYDLLLAWGLGGAGQSEAAFAVVSNLVAMVGKDQPGAAMVRAEFSARQGDIDVVAQMVGKASMSPIMVPRIRALFPCLAAAGRWDAITASDSNVPYKEFSHAQIAIEACLAQNDTAGAAKVVARALATHGNDPRLLRYIYVLSVLWPGSQWESIFVERLVGNLDKVGTDDLVAWIGQNLRQCRPDLAWMAYNRLREMDSDHPAVFLMPAWMGDKWLSFRKRFMGLSSDTSAELISLTPDTYYNLVRSSSPWKKTWKDIPMIGELYAATEDERTRVAETKKKLLDKALVEFAARDRKGTLSVEMRYLYAQASEMTGHADLAHTVLSGIAADHASESNRVLLAHAGTYQHQGDWQNVYETLRDRIGRRDTPLSALLMFCESQYRLTLGVCALETARMTLERHPHSTRAQAIQILLYDMLLGPEETLAAIERSKSRMGGFEPMESDALLKTQRFSEAKVVDRTLSIGADGPLSQAVQAMTLPAAELSLQWGVSNVPSPAQFENNAGILEQNRQRASSPFVKLLMQLWLDCNRSKCAGSDASIDKWAASGRDNMERAAALYQLALLLSRNGKTGEALEAVRRAVAELPRSGLLRRTFVGLSYGAQDVLEEAFAVCPDDPEIWLARLVAGIESGKTETWASEEVRSATAARKYPVATIVRAGDFLLRKHMVRAAAVAARDAEAKARGLVPAHVLALRCAEQLKDGKWALAATARAIEHSLNPQPYLCGKMVEFWGAMAKPDVDVLFALGRLRKMQPENPLWMEMLGRAMFLAGGSHYLGARDQFRDAIAAGRTNRMSFLLLAETERRLGNPRDAAATLKHGLELFPDSHAMLNNLAYTLAEGSETVPEALGLVPLLLKAGGRNTDVLDTVQFIYIRGGRTDLAEQAIADELTFVAEHSTAWAKARLRLAQIRLKEGKLDAAQAILTDLVKTCPLNIPPDELYDAGKLMGEIEQKLFEQKWQPDFL